MEARLNLFGSEIAGKTVKYINTASMVIIKESTLPKATQNLVMLRASQINGCGYCTDVHSKDLAHDGESALRVNLVAAWRETNAFTEAERAALELTEQGTRIADGAGGVTDEARANAAKHYDEEQLTALTLLIALINATNRFLVINRQPGGDYQPGQLG
ncbi:carboxymuconolactone decarboxylase family protein [Streptomyces sp. NPDC002740]